jgi:hypothetical protein
MSRFRFAAAVRKEPMTRRKRFALRSPGSRSISRSRSIRHVEPDILQPVEREAPPVAIARPELFGQTPLDRVDAQRYLG